MIVFERNITISIRLKIVHRLAVSWYDVLQKLCSILRDDIYSEIHEENPTKCNSVPKFYYSLFIWSSTCFERHTAHHQEPKSALAVSGFSYVESCWTCSWWMLSCTLCLTTSTNHTSNNLLIIKLRYTIASCCIFFMNCNMMHGSTNIKSILAICNRAFRSLLTLFYKSFNACWITTFNMKEKLTLIMLLIYLLFDKFHLWNTSQFLWHDGP
jgi:hypothetical protein